MAADTLAAALAEFQKALPRVVKDKTVDTVSRNTGKRTKYSYAGLPDVSEVVLPKMAEFGLSFCCRPTMHPEFGFVLAYQLLHVSGEERSGFYPLNADDGPQARGSAITYARRYCLCAATGVAADEDDDAQAAEHARADGLPANKDGRLSRSRTTDEQKEAAGVMTKAQDAEHSRLAKGTDGRLPPADAAKTQSADTTPPDDPWYGTPRTDMTPREELPSTASRAQLNKVFGLFDQLGYAKDDRNGRLAVCGDIIGREIKSSANLSMTEARMVADVLDGRVKEAADAPA